MWFCHDHDQAESAPRFEIISKHSLLETFVYQRSPHISEAHDPEKRAQNCSLEHAVREQLGRRRGTTEYDLPAAVGKPAGEEAY